MIRRLLPYGAGAVLLECADLAETHRLRPAIEQRFEPVSEIVPGARTLLLRLRRPLSAGERQDLLDLSGVDTPAMAEQETVTIPVEYAGADLAEVAELTATDSRRGGRRPHRPGLDRRPSAASPPASATWSASTTGSGCPGGTDRGRRCRRARSGWRTRSPGSIHGRGRAAGS